MWCGRGPWTALQLHGRVVGAPWAPSAVSHSLQAAQLHAAASTHRPGGDVGRHRPQLEGLHQRVERVLATPRAGRQPCLLHVMNGCIKHLQPSMHHTFPAVCTPASLALALSAPLPGWLHQTPAAINAPHLSAVCTPASLALALSAPLPGWLHQTRAASTSLQERLAAGSCSAGGDENFWDPTQIKAMPGTQHCHRLWQNAMQVTQTLYACGRSSLAACSVPSSRVSAAMKRCQDSAST